MTEGPGVYDLLIEVRDEMRGRLQAIEHILTGNGEPGICEAVRRHSSDISHLMTLADSLATSIGQLSRTQTLHQDWHAKPENYTVQEIFRHRSFLVCAVLIVLVFAIVDAAVTGVDLVTFLKGLLA